MWESLRARHTVHAKTVLEYLLVISAVQSSFATSSKMLSIRSYEIILAVPEGIRRLGATFCLIS